MAESIVFGLASKILSVIASPLLRKAYEKGLSIWEARDELDKLRVTIETIVAVLLDAEKKQEGSAAVRNWIKRLKSVLYDAEDLFDDVATEELLKQQIMKKGNNMLFKKVQVHFSELNPVISRNSIANKVKAIRKRLVEISRDMAGLGFVRCDNVEEGIPTGMRIGQDTGSYIDSNDVIGRDDDKKHILEMLLQDGSFVIAIVGIGGMGKTTLAQLIYNDEDFKKQSFEITWFACISGVYDKKEVIGKIFQSVCKENYSGFTVDELQIRIRESTAGQKFLLILDDVWDDNRCRWLNRLRLLEGGAKGSKIIITTRVPSVVMAMGALKIHNLDGLSDEDSWNLFKRLAFSPEYENDTRRVNLGKKILKKCRNVPLAIRSIASLLSERNTIQEWESISNEELSKLGQSHEDGIMPVLKLSYDHLSSYLKQCFASCSLFRKDYRFHKLDLIYHWIAQGYIISHNERQTLEDVSHSYFMYLVRRGFFQEIEKDIHGEIQNFKMHDLIHDLTQHVSGEENIVLTRSSGQSTCPRHVSVEDKIEGSWRIPEALLKVDGIRSFMFMNGGSIDGVTLNKLFVSYKLLRTLSLRSLGIEEVPRCIGELKHLRSIDLSENNFERLPGSLTNLVNLLKLALSGCSKLKALPDNLRKLINLRHLSIDSCRSLEYMPLGIEELICLQYLWGSFKVGKERSELALAGLQLRGLLDIEFKDDMNSWDGDQCLQLPETLKSLHINYYPGIRIPCWTNWTTANELTLLQLHNSCKLKYLPPLRCLPNLKNLSLEELFALEYVEEEGSSNAGPSTFFPRLETLTLENLPKLKGWRKSCVTTSTPPTLFPSLTCLMIRDCRELKSMPLCPRALVLHFTEVGCQVLQHLLSLPSSISDEAVTSLREVNITMCKDLKIMDLTSTRIEEISISYCEGLTSFKVERPTSLRSLFFDDCEQLKDMHITQADALEELRFESCPKLKLWEQNVDWDSLPNLSLLQVWPSSPLEMLPDCLRQRQALGKLKINV